MIKRLLILPILLSSTAFSSGISLMDARIHPLSINDNNELLYKYVIAENSTGAHSTHPIITGIGVFKDGNYTAITQEILDEKQLSNNAEATYWAKRGQQESWFNQPCENDDLIDGFSSCNVTSQHKNQWMTLTELSDNYQIDLLKAPLITLSSGDIYASNKDRIYIGYDFPNYLLLEFKVESCFDDGLASFIVENTIMNDNANERNSIDPTTFDCAVTSAIVVKP